MSDVKTFIADVDRMRQLQRRYFRTRDLTTLDAARDQERLVDEQLDLLMGRQQPCLPGLSCGGRHGHA